MNGQDRWREEMPPPDEPMVEEPDDDDEADDDAASTRTNMSSNSDAAARMAALNNMDEIRAFFPGVLGMPRPFVTPLEQLLASQPQLRFVNDALPGGIFRFTAEGSGQSPPSHHSSARRPRAPRRVPRREGRMDDEQSDMSIDSADDSVHDGDSMRGSTRSPSPISRPYRFDRPEAYLEAFSKLVSDFTDQYGPEIPSFYPGSFSDARDESRRAGKILMLYLHDNTSPDAQLFCQQVLTHESVLMLLNENFVVWGWDVNEPDHKEELRRVFTRYFNSAYEFMAPEQFPFIAFCITSQGAVHVLNTLTGFISVDEFVGHLLTLMDMHQDELQREKALEDARQQERAERENLIKEQDEAYQAAIEEERKREEQRLLDEQQRQREEEEARRAAEAAEQQRLQEEQMLQREMERIRAALPDEPAPGTPDTVTVQFRLPDGNKLQRRFAGTDRLQTIFDYVTLQGYSVASRTVQLQLNFPRRILSDMDPSLTLREAGLASQETVYIQTA